MTYPKIKIFLSLSISLIVMLAPPAIEILPGAGAHAMGFLGSKAGSDRSPGSRVVYASPQSNPADLDPRSAPPTPVPEPATWLLLGSGAAGLAALKKKFKKK